jgi:hypothetical protein
MNNRMAPAIAADFVIFHGESRRVSPFLEALVTKTESGGVYVRACDGERVYVDRMTVEHVFFRRTPDDELRRTCRRAFLRRHRRST